MDRRFLDNLLVALREMAKNLLLALPFAAALRARLGGGRTTGFYRAEDARCRVFAAWEALALPDLEGRSVLEVGPGAHLGLLLLCRARGASRATAVDRFPEVTGGDWEAEVYRVMGLPAGLAREALPPGGRVGYHAGSLEALDLPDRFDLAVSYHALQHVGCLQEAARALYRHLQSGGVTVHVVDLRALGNVDPGGREPLRHLEFPAWAWTLMGSHRGLPNRARPADYRRALEGAGFADVRIDVLRSLTPEEVGRARPLLRPEFAVRPDEELAPLEIRLTGRKP